MRSSACAALVAAIATAASVTPAAAQGAPPITPPIWHVVSLERCYRLSSVVPGIHRRVEAVRRARVEDPRADLRWAIAPGATINIALLSMPDHPTLAFAPDFPSCRYMVHMFRQAENLPPAPEQSPDDTD
jgi:hypothetical protein